MNDTLSHPLRAASRLELWAWRFFLASVFCLPFSISAAQACMGLAILLQMIRARPAPGRWNWLPVLWGATALSLHWTLKGPFMAAAIVLLALYLWRYRRAWRLTPAFLGFALFLATALFATFYQTQLLRDWSRLSSFAWIIAIPLTATLADSAPRRRLTLQTLAAGCAALALYALIRNPLAARQGVRAGEIWAPDFTAALIHKGSITEGQFFLLGLLATLAAIDFCRTASRARRLWTAALILQVVAFLVNFKRGSWFCALPLIAAFFVLLASRARRRVAWAVLAGVTLLALATPAVRTRLGDLGRELNTRHGGRLSMWTEVAPALIREHPFGIGYGQLTNAKMRQYAPHIERGRTHLHSNIPQILVSTGWIGLAAYLLWMGAVGVTAVRRAWRARRGARRDLTLATTLLLMFLGLMGNGLVEYNFGDTELMMTLCVILGLMDGGDASVTEGPA
jgi:hypothetical protein